MKIVPRIPSKLDEFTSYVNNCEDQSVYIFGADIAGKIVKKILNNRGLHVAGFIDNNKNKTDRQIDGCSVYHATEILNAAPKSIIVLIASTYIGDIARQLEDLGFYNWAPIVGILDQDNLEDYRQILKGDLRKNHSGGEFTEDFDVFVLENMKNSQEKYLDESTLFIRSVDVVITEKCSLKCIDCSNLMQYYESPKNINIEVVKREIDLITEVADEINEIRVIGGDAMVNKEFPEIVNYAAEKSNVRKVVIYTNGTIAPSEEKIKAIAGNPKIFVFITTYGPLSRNAEKLVHTLEANRIQYNNQPAYGWTDCGRIVENKRDEQSQTEIFKNCCAKHFTTLTDGKIFRCPFAANLHRLSATPDFKDDYVQLQQMSTQSNAEKNSYKTNLKRYLREIAYIKYCDFCNGRTYGDPEIEPGKQTKVPLTYVKHIPKAVEA